MGQHIHIHCNESEFATVNLKLDAIINALNIINTKEDLIIMDEQAVKDALTKIDAATTKIGGDVKIVADNTQAINNDVDALLAALKAALASGGGVTQALVDQANALATSTQTQSDALDALVPVLQGIAAKGVINPVPVPVPPSPAAVAVHPARH
jgi:hypothetical protein